MSRLTLIHWKPEEAAVAAERLRRAGHRVKFPDLAGGPALRELEKNPPELFVIDLGRLPAQGRDLAVWLRRRKATRRVPIVFVGGEADKVARVRRLLPDAVYAPWSRVRSAVRRALGRPPKDPKRPGQMDGYSGTPLVKKPGVRADSAVHLLAAPEGFERALGRLPANVRLRRQARGRARLVLLFVRSRAELARRFAPAERSLAEGGGIWIVWPKKTSPLASDVDQAFVRAFGLERGLVDYKIAAIDETWSGLLFARRRAS